MPFVADHRGMFTPKSPMTLDRQTTLAFYSALAQGAAIAPMYGLPVHGPEEDPRPAAEAEGIRIAREHMRNCADEAARFLTMAALAGVEVA